MRAFRTSCVVCHFTPPKPSYRTLGFWSGSSGKGKEGSRFSIASVVEKTLLNSGVTDDQDMARMAGKTVSFGVIGLLGLSALGTVGVDTTPIMTGLGVTGFAVGFAMREIAANYLSGVLLVFSKPFSKGQTLRVQVGSVVLEGQVAAIDVRHVHLITKDQGKLLIPSIMVYSNPITISPSKPQVPF